MSRNIISQQYENKFFSAKSLLLEATKTEEVPKAALRSETIMVYFFPTVNHERGRLKSSVNL